MRAVVQRVNWGRVTVNDEIKGEIKNGLVVLLGIHQDDNEDNARILAKKIPHLRIFSDNEGKMNLSLLETSGKVLAISQFTLYGDCKKGRRPNFMSAASYDEGQKLYELFCQLLRLEGIEVETGVYGAHMLIELENDGPVTLIMDTKDL